MKNLNCKKDFIKKRRKQRLINILFYKLENSFDYCQTLLLLIDFCNSFQFLEVYIFKSMINNTSFYVEIKH